MENKNRFELGQQTWNVIHRAPSGKGKILFPDGLKPGEAILQRKGEFILSDGPRLLLNLPSTQEAYNELAAHFSEFIAGNTGVNYVALNHFTGLCGALEIVRESKLESVGQISRGVEYMIMEPRDSDGAGHIGIYQFDFRVKEHPDLLKKYFDEVSRY